MRFATAKEMRANPALPEQIHSGDQVVHYRNADLRALLRMAGRARARRCVARVVVGV